ncbi:MAG TPA: aminoacyl--tRNA ligase-related protein [Thermoanaerobaculia bacterium]
MLEEGKIPGLLWYESGQSGIEGDLLEHHNDLDRTFLRFADQWGATRVIFPPLISASELEKVAYFESFPQLFTAAAGLESDAENLRAFTAGGMLDDGALKLTTLAPVREILAPAACYPLYIAMQNRTFSERSIFTVRSNCFRREREYHPLQRQWAFTMREIVCIGTGAEVREFLERSRETLDRLFAALALDVTWDVATDPFFDPRNPQSLMQRVDPVKREMTCHGLAIGSINYHRHHFGDAFQIRRGEESIESGCVAFGIERWLHVLIQKHGTDYSRWPRTDGWPR